MDRWVNGTIRTSGETAVISRSAISESALAALWTAEAATIAIVASPDGCESGAVREGASGLVSVSCIGPPPLGSIGGEPLDECGDVDDEGDGPIPQNRRAGEPWDVADQVAERLDDNFLLAEQAIDSQADLALADFDGDHQDVAGIRGNLGRTVEQVGAPHDREDPTAQEDGFLLLELLDLGDRHAQGLGDRGERQGVDPATNPDQQGL